MTAFVPLRKNGLKQKAEDPPLLPTGQKRLRNFIWRSFLKMQNGDALTGKLVDSIINNRTLTE